MSLSSGGLEGKRPTHQLEISPLSVILLLVILILIGGIIGISYYGTSTSITIRNVGCPEIPVGSAMPISFRKEISDYGIAIPDSVDSDAQERISVPNVPVAVVVEVVAENQLQISLLDRHFTMPLPPTVDSVQFDGQEVLLGPISQQLAENPSHEMIIRCP